jgi:hypothetical protein
VYPADNRNFCEVLTQCDLKEATIRTVKTVATVIETVVRVVVDFFTFIIVEIYGINALTCNIFYSIVTCQWIDDLRDDDNGDIINYDVGPRPPVDNQSFLVGFNAKLPPEIPADQKDPERAKALDYLLNAVPAINFECQQFITKFDLDGALKGFKEDLDISTLVEWYDFSADEKNDNQKRLLQNILQRIKNSHTQRRPNPIFKAVQISASKIHDILTIKKERIKKLPQDEQEEARKNLKDEAFFIINSFLDADTNCIDQTLSQVENMLLMIFSSENPLKNKVSRLRYLAAFELFKHRARKIKEICVKLFPKEPHMADLERAVKQIIAGAVGMKGDIIDVGAQFPGIISDLLKKAAAVANGFLREYDATNYLLENCQDPNANFCRKLRAELTQWATEHYDLKDHDDLSMALVTDQIALANCLSIGSVKTTEPGTKFLLSVAGIIKSK